MKKRTFCQVGSAFTVFGVFLWISAFSQTARAQTDQDCERLKRDIKALQDALVEEQEFIEKAQQTCAKIESDIAKIEQTLREYPGLVKYGQLFGIGSAEEYRGHILDLRAAELKVKRAIKDAKEMVDAMEKEITDLQSKLATCGEKKSETPNKSQPKSTTVQPNPTQSTTNKVTDVLKSIGSSVDIGIGGGTSGGQHRRGQKTSQKNIGQKQKTSGNLKMASNPQIARCQQAIDYHSKQKQALEQKLHSAAGAPNRQSLQRQIQAEDDAIKQNQTELSKLGGQ